MHTALPLALSAVVALAASKAHADYVPDFERVNIADARILGSADLDGNGTANVVATFDSPGGLWMMRDDGTWAQLNPAAPESIHVADVDGDGIDDIVADWGRAGVDGGFGLFISYGAIPPGTPPPAPTVNAGCGACLPTDYAVSWTHHQPDAGALSDWIYSLENGAGNVLIGLATIPVGSPDLVCGTDSCTYYAPWLVTLEPGSHLVRLQAWDSEGSSDEATGGFVITSP